MQFVLKSGKSSISMKSSHDFVEIMLHFPDFGPNLRVSGQMCMQADSATKRGTIAASWLLILRDLPYLPMMKTPRSCSRLLLVMHNMPIESSRIGFSASEYLAQNPVVH
jgi:hypothetical protein